MEIDIFECIFTSENQKISPAAGTIVNKIPNSLNVAYFDCQAGMGYVSLFGPFLRQFNCRILRQFNCRMNCRNEFLKKKV